MTWSQAEILALATKAARGAGVPAGQAERFGEAAVVHLLAGRDAAELLGAIEALPRGPVFEHPLAIDMALSAASDDRATLTGPPVDGLFTSYVEALPYKVERGARGADHIHQIDLSVPRSKLATKRIVLEEAVLTALQSYARRILVPDSDASRAAGAGAGLDDND